MDTPYLLVNLVFALSLALARALLAARLGQSAVLGYV